MMNRRRILIANLSKGQLGADKANLLGALLVTSFQLAAMARAAGPEDEREDFYLYIDEFHNFSTDAFTRWVRLDDEKKPTDCTREELVGLLGAVVATTTASK
jgi:superfamily II DNA or RNA helicase